MLTLYMRPGCGHCKKVLEAANALGIVFDLRNIENPEHAHALVARGGVRQVPYFIDEARGVELYESGEIVAYLKAEYPDSSTDHVR